LAIEGILVGIFVVSSYLFSQRIMKSMRMKGRDNVIDVEGEVIKEKERLK
jgi:hypothetical protein